MLEARGVSKRYGAGWRRRGHLALDGVDLTLGTGEALGVIGQSGSGKSTLARLMMGLEAPSAGDIYWNGQALSDFSSAQWKAFRRAAQIVFQDPAAAFNPRFTLNAAFTAPLRNLCGLNAHAARAKAEGLMAEVGLSPAFLDRYPHALSGGQLQRVAIARALAPDPDILLLDESVSALDVSVQAQVLKLIARLRAERNLTLLFVSHDLAVISLICERALVMRDGQVVEEGPTRELLANPRSSYMRDLLDAVPSL